MALTRTSLSSDSELLTEVKRIAAETGTTFSAFVTDLMRSEVERRQRARDHLAEARELNRQAFEAAERMTEADMWGEATPIPDGEKPEFEAQLARVLARSMGHAE